MADVYTAFRRFERFLGIDTHEPPDDRKTCDDMLRYPRQHARYSAKGKPIAKITFCPDTKEVIIERYTPSE